MANALRFEDLEVWQLARSLSDDIWTLIQSSELNKDFGLRNQMNNSSGSIMDNIAEGFERDGNREFKQFLSISKASCGELRSQLYRCLDRKYLNPDEYKVLNDKCILLSKKLSAFSKYLAKSNRKGLKYE